MKYPNKKRIALLVMTSMMACAMLLMPASRINAADHRDGPRITDLNNTPTTDIDDLYLFLDPNDNTKVILAFDVAAPIIPAENANAGFFDSAANFRLQIENTGDARGDLSIDIIFTKPTAPDQPRMAIITLPRGQAFTAPTTVPSATANTPPPPVVTTDPVTGISFFAGLADDPFFFDLPAELRYRASRLAGTPDPSFFDRARDSFAGYNALMIALSVPASLLRGPGGT